MEFTDPYQPNTWQEKFHRSSVIHKCASGGLGSGKSFCAIQELKQCALEYPGSIWVLGRKLLPSLRDSTWRDLLNIIPNELVQSYNKNHLTLVLKNKSEFWGRPLYDPEIFKSYQIAGFMIDEANEVDEDIYKRLKDRMRQMLPNRNRPRYQSILCLNPTEEDHWIPQTFLYKKLTNHELFQSTTFDNKANLPPNYVEELQQMYAPDVLQRLLYGVFGKVHKGRPVYPQFKIEVHMKPVQFNPDLPLIRGWDFGYNHPAVLWAQLHGRQLRLLGEKMGKKIYLDRFIEDEVLPYERSVFGKVYKYIDVCDPHGASETDKGKTSLGILNEHMIFPKFKRITIEEGIKAVNFHLDTIDAQSRLPNFLVHPRCRIMVDGLKGGYHRLENEDIPEKDNYYDHLQDTLRYIAHIMTTQMRTMELLNSQNYMEVFVDPVSGRRLERPIT